MGISSISPFLSAMTFVNLVIIRNMSSYRISYVDFNHSIHIARSFIYFLIKGKNWIW